jgi:thiol-disulfide isomerase/thioredoxin
LNYQNFTSDRAIEIEKAKAELANAKTATDSAKFLTAMKKGENDIQQNRKEIITNNPEATITALLLAMKDPVIPKAENHPGGKYDSTFAYRYYKDHYWDDTYFFDERLVRTTFFEEKLDRYFEQLIAPDPDSVIKELDWMLAYASVNSEMQRFLLAKFVNRYLNLKYLWEDKVYVHLFEKYFSQKDYPWLTQAGKKTIFDRAYSLMANLFGTQSADIDLPDSTGRQKKLFAITNPYTLVVFWDPTCGHCKETLPKIDSIYRAKWKALNVKIYAVAKETDGTKKDWLTFVNEQQLAGWEHVYYSRSANDARVNNNIPSYFQLYDVQTVPTLYLLDKDKRILAKKMPFEQIDIVLDHKLQGK